MAVAPGSSSGTYTFQMANSSVVLEAFDRCGVRPTELQRHHMDSARNSLQLELLAWSNQGWNFWETVSGTINLVTGQATYAMPANLVTISDMFYSNVNGLGTGVNNDRIMQPITRDEYASLTNKLQQGIPTQYWYQMLITPQVTIWEVPAIGAPNYVLGWYGLSQIQDANLGGGEVPNIHYRAYDALCAGLAKRLARKFKPDAYQGVAQDFAEAWEAMVRRDQEPGSTTFRPDVSSYSRMR